MFQKYNVFTAIKFLEEGKKLRFAHNRKIIIEQNESGDIVWADDGKIVNLTKEFLNSEFEIVPNYINYPVALNYYNLYKTVYYHQNLANEPIKFSKKEDNLNKSHKLTLDEIITGKWFILD